MLYWLYKIQSMQNICTGKTYVNINKTWNANILYKLKLRIGYYPGKYIQKENEQNLRIEIKDLLKEGKLNKD